MNVAESLPACDGTRRQIADTIVARWDEVEGLARQLHANPELGFREFASAKAIADYLAEQGFAVERGGRLPTAFTASYGDGDFVVGLCVEYDALPTIGHACGHNLIMGASVAAGLGLKSVADELGLTVKLIGTPYEEGGGGKIYALQEGAFDDVHVSLMVHMLPDGFDCAPAGTSCQAIGRWRATFTGASAHAAAAPWRAVNAADAAVVAQVAMALLRQQTPENHRMNMVIEHAGDVTNVIAGSAQVHYEARAWTVEEFEVLAEKVHNCFRAGALATGCDLEITPTDPAYEPLIQDEILSEHWCDAFASFGRNVAPGPGLPGGSTDMGNVTQVLPGLHPWVSIPGVNDAIHTTGFAAAANTEAAYQTMFESAVSMAWCIESLVSNEEHVNYCRERLASRAPIAIEELPGEHAIVRE